MRPILALAALLATPALAAAPPNFGATKADAAKPFTVTPVATFDNPWKIAFLPDGRMLVTEKPGHLYLVTQRGSKAQVSGLPKVAYEGQGGLLGVAVSPRFGQDHSIYLTYAEPGVGGSGLALARARIVPNGPGARLEGLQVLWRELPRGQGGQFGGYMAFPMDGSGTMFLTVGERQRFTPAQDPNQATGKILRLTFDGKPAPGNPMAGKTGATTVTLTDPPADTVAAKTAAGRKVTVPSPNLVPAETWTAGHRNQYGLAFDAAGHLWETEMGPMGGDEFNLILPGKNYGWPSVSWGDNYDGKPIPRPTTQPKFQEPALYWNPVIAPAGLTYYTGSLFSAWKGSFLVGGLAGQCIVRIAVNGTSAKQVDRWDMGNRIRDVLAGPDGALWALEDGDNGRLLRITPR